ncbi:hypothetical protein LCGC14_1706960 [marine sediment metagenome]|uniref:Uncharacterized protein n=1 Tax=marine sediment metagenome TaxID=412755 RepID=A0A0F9JWR6_9ZZZZ
METQSIVIRENTNQPNDVVYLGFCHHEIRPSRGSGKNVTGIYPGETIMRSPIAIKILGSAMLTIRAIGNDNPPVGLIVGYTSPINNFSFQITIEELEQLGEAIAEYIKDERTN